jgi:hypothetical protein
MSEHERPLPDLTSIFTAEYWQNNPIGEAEASFHEALPPRMPRGLIEKNSRPQVENAVAQAAMQIYLGEKLQPIPSGELVGTDEDVDYAVPGNILLFDTELLLPTGKKHAINQLSISGPAELQASAPSIMRESTVRVTAFEAPTISLATFMHDLTGRGKATTKSVAYDNPFYETTAYIRWAQDPAKGIYKRAINLLAFATDKHGSLVAKHAEKSRFGEGGLHRADLYSPFFHHAGRVGETYTYLDKKKLPQFTRTRAAYICARGAFEYAKVARSSRSRRVGRLVVNQQNT